MSGAVVALACLWVLAAAAVVVLACLWVLAAVEVAFLPRCWRFAPGLVLLAAAVWLIWRLAAEYGLWAALPALLAAGAMSRRRLAGPPRRPRPGRGGAGEGGE